MNFYVLGKSVDDIQNFFSVLPEEQRPKIVSDKEYPAAWDHASDKPTIIATEEPRLDTEAKELNLEGAQADEVMKQMQPEEGIVSEDVTIEPEPEQEEEKKTEGPFTYADRGFKVGKLV